MSAKTLYIIRHGQTDFNKRNIVQGSGIDSDLNVVGRLQAESFYDFYKDEGFELVYTSSLKRAIQSVESFITNGMEHRVHRGLNEINWGIMEGKESTPQQRRIFDNILNEWRNGNLNTAVESGETPLQLFERQKQSMQDILNTDANKILISSHGRALRSFMCLLTGQPQQNMHLFPHTNLGLYVLEQVDENRFEIILKNNTDHLAEALLTSYY
ncbi:MAG: histidine phosphatase family protein [Bacteroidetes bacterium]|nr:histidine phosphatase family protein [Bacteroidota bacterium]